jgi:hypothetical protein
MVKQLHIFENADKDIGNWVESWPKPKNRNIGQFPHPFRMSISGSVSRGKTNYAKNVLVEAQKLNKKFKRLIVITCSADSNEWADCDPEIITDEIPDMSIFDQNTVKTLIVIDDYDFTACSKADLKQLSKLFRYYSSHKNISVICNYQSFFHIPKIIRKCSNIFTIYKPNSKQELTMIANRTGINERKLKSYFKKGGIASGRFDCITVDHTIDSPAPLRKCLFEVIEDSDSDDE